MLEALNCEHGIILDISRRSSKEIENYTEIIKSTLWKNGHILMSVRHEQYI